MSQTIEMQVIAHIRSDFPSKFGIPRQSGLAKSLKAEIIFTPEFRNSDALRGLDGFSHLWLIWQFSDAVRSDWSPTVRPPRLGGNTRMGVFATRSPFRPNSIGLSSVVLDSIDFSGKDCPVIHVSGADLMDGTPILDIKPYLPYTDAHPHAKDGFALSVTDDILTVNFPENLLAIIPEDKRAALISALAQDPRPGYHLSQSRVYGFPFAGFEIRFSVSDNVLTVWEVYPTATAVSGKDSSNN